MSPEIKNFKKKLASKSEHPLLKVTFEYQRKDGKWQKQEREVYDRGNAATVLLYNPKEKTVLFTRQFRIPTYMNGNESGMMVETCAGMMDDESPEDCIRREIREETGYRITEVKKVFETYLSPASVTEMLYFFVAEYSKAQKVDKGGGLAGEQEEIDLLEVSYDEAFKMMKNGEIKDAKTILLLQYAKLSKLI